MDSDDRMRYYAGFEELIKNLQEVIPDHILHLELCPVKQSGINRIQQTKQLENIRIAYFMVPRYTYIEPKATDMLRMLTQRLEYENIQVRLFTQEYRYVDMIKERFQMPDHPAEYASLGIDYRDLSEPMLDLLIDILQIRPDSFHSLSIFGNAVQINEHEILNLQNHPRFEQFGIASLDEITGGSYEILHRRKFFQTRQKPEEITKARRYLRQEKREYRKTLQNAVLASIHPDNGFYPGVTSVFAQGKTHNWLIGDTFTAYLFSMKDRLGEKNWTTLFEYIRQVFQDLSPTFRTFSLKETDVKLSMPDREADQILPQNEAFSILSDYYLQSLELLWDSSCSDRDEAWLTEYLDNLVSTYKVDYRLILSCEYKTFQIALLDTP